MLLKSITLERGDVSFKCLSTVQVKEYVSRVAGSFWNTSGIPELKSQ